MGYLHLCAVEVADQFSKVEVKAEDGSITTAIEPQRITVGIERPPPAPFTSVTAPTVPKAVEAAEEEEKGGGDDKEGAESAGAGAGGGEEEVGQAASSVSATATAPVSDAVLRVRRLNKLNFGDAIITAIDFATDSSVVRFSSKHGFAGSYVTKMHYVRVPTQKVMKETRLAMDQRIGPDVAGGPDWATSNCAHDVLLEGKAAVDERTRKLWPRCAVKW